MQSHCIMGTTERVPSVAEKYEDGIQCYRLSWSGRMLPRRTNAIIVHSDSTHCAVSRICPNVNPFG